MTSARCIDFESAEELRAQTRVSSSEADLACFYLPGCVPRGRGICFGAMDPRHCDCAATEEVTYEKVSQGKAKLAALEISKPETAV